MDYIDYSIDYCLEKVKEKEQLQEFDTELAVAGAAAFGSILVVYNLISFLLAASTFKKTIKIDPVMGKKLNGILSSGNYWKVHIYPDPTPNAFAIGGTSVFMTTGLKKMLNEREVMAVLLHEVFHNKDLHVWKKVSYESALTYLIVFISISVTLASGGIPLLGFLVGYIMKFMSNIAYARIVGRQHEIKADEFAVKYGYGDELVASLEKLEKIVEKAKNKMVCGKVCQLERKISEAIDEHPPFKKRVEIILQKVNELDRAMSGGLNSLKKFVLGVFKNNG